MIRLEPLGPHHAEALLAGQDELLADEVVGARWSAESLDAFLARAARWRTDGPIREVAAMRDTADGPELLGGGGLQRLAPGLDRGQAALTYWVLQARRGRGHGHTIAAALVDLARSDPRIRGLVLRIAPANAASQAVAAALGAHRTGLVERHPADARRGVERWVLDLGGEG